MDQHPIYTYYFPDIIAKCGVCPYVGNKDDDETRKIWLELNGANDIYKDSVDRIENLAEIRRIENVLAAQCDELTRHLNAISTRFLDQTFTFSKENIREMIVQNAMTDENSQTNLKKLVNDSGLKTSQAFLDVIPTTISQAFAGVKLTGIISFSWLKEIDDLANEIKHLKRTLQEEMMFIDRIKKDSEMLRQQAATGQMTFGRFSTQHWKNMSQKIKSDRVLYYAHQYVHATGHAPGTTEYYKEISEILSTNKKAKVKWNSKLGLVEVIEIPVSGAVHTKGTPQGAAIKKRKRNKLENTVDEHLMKIRNRQIGILVLCLATPEIFREVEKNNSINVTLLSEFIIKASPKHDEEYVNLQSLTEVATKAITQLNDEISLS